MADILANSTLSGTSVENATSGIPSPQCTPDPDSTTEVVLKCVALGALLLTSLIGNILVILVIYRNKSMRTTVNYFIVNMAVSDLIIPLVVLPRHILEMSTGTQAWRIHGTLGVLTCKLVFFISDITPAVSVLSLVFMTADRFSAVAFPLRASAVPSYVRKVLILITWIFSMAFFAPYFYSFDLTLYKGDIYCLAVNWGPSSHNTFTVTVCVVFIIIPFTLLAGLYAGILVILRRNRCTGESVDRQRKRRERVNTAIIKLALTIVLIFAICWGPYNGIMFLLTFFWNWPHVELSRICSWPTIWFIVQYLAYLPPALNPMIYFILNENYRTGLRRTLRGKSCGHSESTAMQLLSSTRIRKPEKNLHTQQ